MKKVVLTACVLSALALMSGCGGDSGGDSDEVGGNGAAISIATVNGGQHQLEGSYITECYGSPDGRVDSLYVKNTTWNKISSIYTGDDTCQINPSAQGIITAIISKGADKPTSGWKGQGDVAPQRADATGSLSENETVTTFNIKVTEIDDPSNVFGGNVSVGFEASAFYVFDDTAGNGAYVMYSDDDGSFASASDPYVYTPDNMPATLKFMPVIAVSGNTFDMGYSGWANDCYINGTIGDSKDTTGFSVIGDPDVDSVYTRSYVYITQEMYGSTDGSCDPLTKNALNPDVIYAGEAELVGTSGSITGWVDGSGSTVSAPMRQDGTAALMDSESYTEMTFIVQVSSIPVLVPVGTTFPLAYIVDDTGAVPVIYSVDAGVANVDSIQTCMGCP